MSEVERPSTAPRPECVWDAPRYMVTARFRRSEQYRVKPEVDALDGTRFMVRCLWGIEDDHPLYPNEHAWEVVGRPEVRWIASGDLADWEEVPNAR